MSSFVKAFGFSADPFREYVAENEPNIEAYAVRPPYFVSVADRAQECASFVLFGRRGAGKSATRLTVYKEIWKRREAGHRTPLPVTMIDFGRILSKGGLRGVDRSAFAKEAAYLTIEAVLIWLTSLEDDVRDHYLKNLSSEQQSLISALLKSFYLGEPEAGRRISSTAAFRLLNQAWTTKASHWTSQRWSAVSGIFSSVLSAFMQSKAGTNGSEEASIRELLLSFGGSNNGEYTVALLEKLTEFVQIFGFSGIVMLIDKVDETEFTTHSADSTAALIQPIVSHIQLLEIDNFGWIFFVWDKVRDSWTSKGSGIRLDKIASSNIDWDKSYLEEMVAKRLEYFSGGSVKSLRDVADETIETNLMSSLIDDSMVSPRELIRLLDTIIREHDQVYGHLDVPKKLDGASIDYGANKYAKDVISNIFEERVINQFIRLENPVFTNKEVQSAFKVGSGTARNRITSWMNAGIVKLTGTRAAEGDAGGKPQNEYAIVDTRLSRIVSRKLIEVHGAVDEFDEPDADSDREADDFEYDIDELFKE